MVVAGDDHIDRAERRTAADFLFDDGEIARDMGQNDLARRVGAEILDHAVDHAATDIDLLHIRRDGVIGLHFVEEGLRDAGSLLVARIPFSVFSEIRSA